MDIFFHFFLIPTCNMLFFLNSITEFVTFYKIQDEPQRKCVVDDKPHDKAQHDGDVDAPRESCEGGIPR